MHVLGSPVEGKSPATWRKGVSKWIKKPLSPSSRNNGSQAHKINKWALRKQMGLKEPRERERSSKPMSNV